MIVFAELSQEISFRSYAKSLSAIMFLCSPGARRVKLTTKVEEGLDSSAQKKACVLLGLKAP